MYVQYHVTRDKNLPLIHIFRQEYQNLVAFAGLISSPSRNVNITPCPTLHL